MQGYFLTSDELSTNWKGKEGIFFFCIKVLRTLIRGSCTLVIMFMENIHAKLTIYCFLNLFYDVFVFILIVIFPP